MLTLLRRYQKSIFAVVTVMVITSFLFFGTYGAMKDSQRVVDAAVGRAIDGSKLYSSELHELMRFLESDATDAAVLEEKGIVNWFNDGVVRQDFLAGGLGLLAWEAYQSELQADVEERMVKWKPFTPYVHPQKIVSVEGCWQYFAPSCQHDYQDFKRAANVKEAVDAMMRLYVDQSTCTPQLMRQIMQYQQNMYVNSSPNQVIRDPYLDRGDLALFHAKSLSDWFGKRYLELVAQVIHNGAIYAKSKGYHVSAAEAKVALMQIGRKQLTAVSKGKVIGDRELAQFFQRQVTQLHMDEAAAVKVWQKVMLCRRLFDDVTSSMLADSLLYREFHEMAGAVREVELYELPEELRLKTVRDLLGVELYMRAVAATIAAVKEGAPDQFANTKEVERRAPELIEHRFLVKVSQITRAEVAAQLGLREVWAWEIEDSNWALLQQQFAEVRDCVDSTLEGRFNHLQGIDERVRFKMDQYAKKEMVLTQPEMIEGQLAAAAVKKQILHISPGLVGEILPGVEDAKRLLALLKKGEMTACYSENQEIFYRFEVIESDAEAQILTLSEAKKRGALDQMVDHLLEKEYEGKALEEVQDRLVERVFGKGPSLEKRIEGRFTNYMNKMWAAAKRGETVHRTHEDVQKEDQLLPKAPLHEFFLLKKRVIDVASKESHSTFASLCGETLFKSAVGEWSDLYCHPKIGSLFYFVVSEKIDESAIAKAARESEALIEKDAKASVFKLIIDCMQEKAEVYFSKVAEE